ncbi:uncharacterized protein B0I36DRAFT_333779 [Microdochium trichocladiopsis]|uniref:tRNA wybutosine-synthesizing protein 4 n=1 Tax=Microdochium trichocladiopsis TaxID=1682393 RepID=A0A9P8XYX0_9PEZI|nr:uncharacterized protein B0I36DRAFT_333779 [Microdochium trichocladiopsis]KAH7021098.1 hypothetical protein B0I36DRAFT_333779 [Microdochium trichocladiopsis]
MSAAQDGASSSAGPSAAGSGMPKASSRRRPAGRSAKDLAQDDIVMATNSSSIVSKRSVEKIYYPGEPHFFRYFVKKFQRRSPLINRGYHLRLHVIDVAVRSFLRRPTSKTKVVVNLGCGSDVLPWQCFTRYPENCRGAKFVDIDFPDLLRRKCNVVQDTPELLGPLDNVTIPTSGQVFLTSDQYVQIGCDLRELGKVEESLASVLDIPNCEFLFVAEVSITYMETEGADGVIKWASSLGDVEFCLLEQILPDGPEHPFAKTMLQHFNKLKAPPKSVFVYPTLQAQRDRFGRLGWSHADVKSLWQIWTGNDYLSVEDRKELNDIEPFDEWEEFALFAGHYCVVSARTSPGAATLSKTEAEAEATNSSAQVCPEVSTIFYPYQGTRGQRRFGASLKINNTLGESFLSNIFGLGTNTRLRSQDIYGSQFNLEDVDVSSESPSSRMCHATTELRGLGNILCGGRTSPSSALKDAWLLRRHENSWSRIKDLPTALYRHGLTRLGSSHNMALVLGGKTSASAIFQGCLIYQPGSEWRACQIQGTEYVPVFGAVLLSFPDSESGADGLIFTGVLLGGMLEDGTIAKQALHWTLKVPKGNEAPTIIFEPLAISDRDSSKSLVATINRFGATGLNLGGSSIAIVGGIIENELLRPDQEIVQIDFVKTANASVSDGFVLEPIRLATSERGRRIPRPLLVGISAATTDDGKLVIMGGGGVCFSMGSYWNEGCYTVQLGLPQPPSTDDGMKPPGSWALLRTQEITDGHSALNLQAHPQPSQKTVKVDVPKIRISSNDDFVRLLTEAKPVIIEGLDLGSCVQGWDVESIIGKVGTDRSVVIHEAESSKMDFNGKNFSYTTKSFAEFMRDADAGKPVYLRALSGEKPSDQPADLDKDFPVLAADFTIPDALQFVRDNVFSSVLRVSGGANMWLHYDVMANVYCQIRGSKRLVLFPPSDVSRLSFAPGASSSSLNVFEHLDEEDFSSLSSSSAAAAAALLSQTHPHEAILKPGDVLFLPALWPHTAQPIMPPPTKATTATTGGAAGVAVNIFFRSLVDSTSYAAGRDVYGNRDLAAYEKGRQDVARIARAFDDKGVPEDMKEFYILRLADELLGKRRGVAG